MRNRRILLHYHNREILALYGADQLSDRALLSRTLLLTRYALLVSEGPLVVLPKYFFEVPYFDQFIWHVRPIISAGLLQYASGNPDFESELEDKRLQFRDQPALFPGYFDVGLSRVKLRSLKQLVWAPRSGPSATEAIVREWSEVIEREEGRLASLVRGEASNLARRLAEVPAALDGRAFVLGNVVSLLPFCLTGWGYTQLNIFINGPYLRVYLESLDAAIFVDTPLGPMDCGLADVSGVRERLISFRRLRDFFGALGLRETVECGLTVAQLVELREDLVLRWLVGWVVASEREEGGYEALEGILRAAGVYELCNERRQSGTEDLGQVRAYLSRLRHALADYETIDWSLYGSAFVRAARSWMLPRLAPASGATRLESDYEQLWLPGTDREVVVTTNGARVRRPVVGILTVREEEFRAVLARFPEGRLHQGNRLYTLAEVQCRAGPSPVTVAMFRIPQQGNGPAQDATRDLIEDLQPDVIILVGIGGALPAAEYTLGDVIVATSILDLRVRAVLEGGIERAVSGGPVHKGVATVLAHLPALETHLGSWSLDTSVGAQRPHIDCDALMDSQIYGSDAWRDKVLESLRIHFGGASPRSAPRVIAGGIASSDNLIKGADEAESTRSVVRQILGFEMEAAGVFEAAHRREKVYPVLVARGISDVVGLKRDHRWTEYACHTGASFVQELIVSGLLARVLN
jgi:nucleoside phosphorylase